MKNKTIVEVTCGLLIILFYYTGIAKLADLNGFRHDLYNQPFPTWLSTNLLWALPSIEILIGTFLLFRKTQIVGLYMSFFLMSLFTIYVAAILLHVFQRIPCSCGGVIKQLTWPQHLIFNLFFLISSAISIVVSKRTRFTNSMIPSKL